MISTVGSLQQATVMENGSHVLENETTTKIEFSTNT